MKKSKKITKISAPYDFEQGIKITTNKETGKYDGVPRGFLGVVPRSCVNSFLDDRNVPHDLIPCSCSCTEGIRLHAQSMKGPHPELLLSQDTESAMSNEEIRHEWVPLKEILKLHDPTQGLTDMSLIATGGCIAGYALCAFSPVAWLGLAGCALVGLSVGIMWPGTISLASAGMPRGGTALFALLALAGDVGCMAGPSAVGALSDAFSGDLRTGIAFGLFFPVLMGAVLLFSGLKRKKAPVLLNEKDGSK